MLEFAISKPSCVNTIQSYNDFMLNGANGCGTFFSYIYFIIFVLLFRFIILNIFLAIVVDSYNEILVE